MAVQIKESKDSRKWKKSSTPSAELIYNITGTADQDEVVSLAESTSPEYFKGIRRRETHTDPIFVDITEPDTCVWQARLVYRDDTDGAEDDYATKYSINTSITTERVKKSLYTVWSTPDAPNQNDLIGANVDTKSVEGADVWVGKTDWTESHYVSSRKLMGSYISVLTRMGGSVNALDFKGFPAGTLLFAGAVGSWSERDRGTMLDYRFIYAPKSIEKIEQGEVELEVIKDGWDYLWTLNRIEHDEENKTLKLVIDHAYIDRTIRRTNFADLDIGT